MNQLSIKMKITLWYTLFMTLLILIILSLLISISNYRIITNAKDELVEIVTKSAKEIEYEDGYLEFDEDFTALTKGVYLSVYNIDGTLLYGRIPPDFDATTRFVKENVRKTTTANNVWYVYDYSDSIKGYGEIWIRGVLSQTQGDAAIGIILGLSLILLPIFVLCVAFGGYSITRKTLLPLSKMTETARSIGTGTDLKTRIKLGAGKDEVHQLASTFDHMMDRLEEAFENEKQFTSDVSHELRTPVSVISTQCEYSLRENLSKEDMKERFSIILEQSKMMSNLISQLLTIARTDHNQQPLHLETVNLSELAEIVVEEQRHYATEKNITLNTDISPDIFMMADETMMMRLFINLISNSITYGRVGGDTLVSLKLIRKKIIGSVIDNGIGIQADQLDKIWRRFYQVDPSRTFGKHNGAGLGLPMVKWIVESHGGSVSVTSEYGKGSTFSFEFYVN